MIALTAGCYANGNFEPEEYVQSRKSRYGGNSKMCRTFLAVVAALLSCRLGASQTLVSPKSPQERAGLHHTTIRGRFLSPGGQPIQGVRVQMNAGRPRALPLVDVVSSADGTFEIRGVSSPYMPDLRWYPPEEWLSGAMPLLAESGSTSDAGVIRLQPNTIVRIAVEIVGGSPLPDGAPRLTIVFQGPNQFTQRIVADAAGTYQVIRQITFDEGTFQATLFANRKPEVFSAPFKVTRGRRDQLLTFRLLRDTVTEQGQYVSTGRMEIVESSGPAGTVEKEFTAIGRVVGPDGTPVAGAIVNVKGLPFERKVARWVASDVQGSFQLRYRAQTCMDPSVSYGDSDYWISREAVQNREPCESRWQNPRDIVMPSATHLALKVLGVEPTAARAYWWHDSFGWQPFSSLGPWISVGGFREMTVKVEADGFLPLIQSPKLPRVDWTTNEKPPGAVPVEFLFDSNIQRELIVRGGAGPLAGATVDVEWIENLDSDHRRLGGSYKTGPDGRVRLKGGGDRLVEALIYADGFEPRRAMWNPGTLLILELTPRSSTLVFPASSAIVGSVRDVDSPPTLRSLRLNPNEASPLKLKAGTYDVTIYDDRGEVAQYQRVSIAPGESKPVDSTLDQRPHLTVRYADGWHATVSDSTPRGGAVGWVAMISIGGSFVFSGTPATIEHQTSREAVFSLSRAGRMHVELRRDRQSLSLWREIDVRPGESVTLDAPTGDSTLKGSMRTYDGGLGMSEHGWAGPRMQLIADDPAAWSITEYLPARDSRTGDNKDRFTIRDLPAGRYHLYQHLIGTPGTYRFGGKEYPYTAPIDAWGGIAVRLEPGATAQLNDFIDYRFADLRVRVSDSDGRPIENATLRIRDRMAEM